MASSREEVEIRVLGELAVFRRGKPVELPASKKTRALLAYLVLTGRTHLRTTLCDLLWAGPDDPRAALRWSLSKLKSAIGAGDPFTASRDHLGIEPSRVSVDLARVRDAVGSPSSASREVLEDAAKRFRGELLEGLDLADAYRFHEWCLGEREAARRLRSAILAELVVRLANEPAAALAYARTRVAIDPLDESVHADVVRLLVELGDRQQADAHVESCTRMFERELGRPPSAALLRARVRAPRPSSPELVPAPARPAPVAASPLIGRGRERARIEGAVATCATGGTDAVLVFVGEPGIGKSRLLDETARLALERGGFVLRGRAHEAEMVRPYGPWIDALRSISLDAVEPEHRAMLTALVPELGGSGEVGDRQRLFDALARALGDLARSGPLAVLLDGLQWFDEASVALLHYVAREPRPGMLFACTARRAELADNLHALKLLRGLARERRSAELSIQPLEAGDAEALARSIGGSIDVSGVFAETAGNPLFVIELARALARGASPTSESLAQLIDDRLERIGGSAREILPWAAALGRSFDLDTLGRASGVAAGALIGAVAELETHGILRESASGRDYDFAHDLVRNGAYRQLSEPRRRMVHRQIALALGDPAAQGGAPGASVAHHAALAGARALAGERALAARACAAAEYSHGVFANDDAARLALMGLQHVRDLPHAERVELELSLLRMCVLSGRFHGRDAEIEAELARASEEARTLGLAGAAARGFHVLSILQHDRGDYELASRSTVAAAESVQRADAVTRARQTFDTARCLAHLGREMARADALLAEALALGAEGSLDATITEWPKGLLACWKGDYETGEAALRRAALAARADNDHWVECDVGLRLAMSAFERGAFDVAKVVASEIEAVSGKLGEGAEGPSARAIHVLARLGAEEDVAGELAEVIASLRRIDAKGMLAYTLVCAAELAVERGNLAFAEDAAKEAAEPRAAQGHRGPRADRARRDRPCSLGRRARGRRDRGGAFDRGGTARAQRAHGGQALSHRFKSLKALSISVRTRSPKIVCHQARPPRVVSPTAVPNGARRTRMPLQTHSNLVSPEAKALPLKAAKLAVDAGLGLAEVVLEQRFSNPHAEPLHVTYSLPLPHDAAVSRFRFRVGDRVIEGTIETRDKARERYEEAIATGHTAALLEQDRASLFTQEIGNVPPGAEIVCEVGIDQKLVWSEGGFEWRFPLAAAPRYLGAEGRTPDAGKVSFDVAEALSVRASMTMSIRDPLGVRSPESPSHPLRRREVAPAQRSCADGEWGPVESHSTGRGGAQPPRESELSQGPARLRGRARVGQRRAARSRHRRSLADRRHQGGRERGDGRALRRAQRGARAPHDRAAGEGLHAGSGEP
jgi:DNA-binding SARP family transcriptional activator